MHDPLESRPPTSANGSSNRLRDRLYDIIFEADTRAGKAFDIGLLMAIVVSVTIVCLETVPAFKQSHGPLLIRLEWFFTALFGIEYTLRLICVRNRYAYATSFYGVIDLLSFLPSILGLIMGGTASFAVVRAFRLLRVFRVFKLLRLSREAEALAHSLWRSRGKVVVFLAFVAIVVTVSGALMYEIEHGGNPHETSFSSIPQSIYWAIVTMTTVGYGDIVPETSLGKFVSAFLILIGYSLIIVPTGFVSAEMISARQASWEPSRTCPNCLAEGHTRDAKHCHDCGAELVP